MKIMEHNKTNTTKIFKTHHEKYYHRTNHPLVLLGDYLLYLPR